MASRKKGEKSSKLLERVFLERQKGRRPTEPELHKIFECYSKNGRDFLDLGESVKLFRDIILATGLIKLIEESEAKNAVQIALLKTKDIPPEDLLKPNNRNMRAQKKNFKNASREGKRTT